MTEGRKGLSPEKFPIGWRFLPTDEELVNDYLMNKVLYKPLPAHVVKEINAFDLYSKPPWDLVTYDWGSSEEREWFFYVHGNEDEKVCKKAIETNYRNNGEGLWRLDGNEHIPNSDCQVVASKNQLTYFKLSSKKKPKKTHWKMEVYRLSCGCRDTLNFKGENWAVGRIKRGVDYSNM